MRELVLKGFAALMFGAVAAYFGYAAANSAASEHCILAASSGFLFLTLSLAFLPTFSIERSARNILGGKFRRS